MFNVQCSSVGKDKGAVQISNIGWQTLLFALGKHGICQRATKLKIQNDDDDANTK